jgi:hypothetical protein
LGHFARSAAEINGSSDARGVDQSEEIAKWLQPLLLKESVLFGTPAVSHEVTLGE